MVRKIVNCEICGTEFECEGSSLHGCWCSNIVLSEEKRSELIDNARDCVCRTCLEE